VGVLGQPPDIGIFSRSLSCRSAHGNPPTLLKNSTGGSR
jgi:hypothetical protein